MVISMPFVLSRNAVRKRLKFVTQFMNTWDRKVNCFSPSVQFTTSQHTKRQTRALRASQPVRDAQKQLHKNSWNRVFQIFFFSFFFVLLGLPAIFISTLMWNSAHTASSLLIFQCLCKFCTSLIIIQVITKK